MDSLIDYVSTYDSLLLQKALKENAKFTPTLFTAIVGILSQLGCSENPTPSNLHHLLINAAKHQFKIKPLELSIP